MYGPSTSEYDIQSVQYEAVEREAEKTFEIEIRKSYTIRKSISAHSKEDAVERQRFCMMTVALTRNLMKVQWM